MSIRWTGVCVFVFALMAYGCDTANGGPIGEGGEGGDGGTGGVAGTGGDGGTGGVAGTGGDGGTGGTGGTVDLCMDVDCSDGNDCTQDVCDSADGTCSNPDELDGSSCDFGGLPGICAAGVCEDALLCDGVDCSDDNDCTADLCDPADGACSNPDEIDGTACDFGGLPGTCAAGVCEDAMLCDEVDCSDGNDCSQDVCDPQDGTCSNPDEMDGTACDFGGLPGICTAGACEDAMLCAGVDCSDGDDCTQDICDPADGTCSNPDEIDGTSCDFGGLPGVCAAGVCEDAMLCDAVDCSDGNDCTQDICDPLDGTCSNPDETDGTVCDAMGISGTCQTGTCVADCTPTPGMSVTLPTSGAPTGTYTDMANGFTITAANCDDRPKCEVTFSFAGVGASSYGTFTGIDAGDSFLIEFFDMDGAPRDASNVSLLLGTGGVAGIANVLFDGMGATSYAAVPGQAIDLSGQAAHAIEVTFSTDVNPPLLFWEVLDYDHECL